MNSPSFVQHPRDREPPPEWSDTVPACFRSEAFAEDVADADATGRRPAPVRSLGFDRLRRPLLATAADGRDFGPIAIG